MPKDPKAKYTTLWTFRGIMLLRMEQAGMKSLPLGRISVAKFVKMNPDQTGKLMKIITARADKVGAVQELVTLCGGPCPELLSMVCCFAGDKCMDTVDIDTMDDEVWIETRKRLERQYGMPPHLSQVCKKMKM